MPNNEVTEQDVQRSIEETGGIPVIEMSMEVSGMTQYPVDKTLSIPDMAADAKETGDRIANANEAILDNSEAIRAIEEWTGSDIPVNAAPNAKTIEEAINNMVGMTYPVGSIFMTLSSDPPDFLGTWVEVGITATLTQFKNGKRGYEPLEEGDTGDGVHFWLRTE